MTAELVEIDSLLPLHGVRDVEKVKALKRAMVAGGWVGRPLLGVDMGDHVKLVTGSHRLVAARRAGLETVPVVVIEAHMLGYDGDCEECGDEEGCWVEQLLEASDDDDRIGVVGLPGQIRELLELEE